jgi:uncharacterized protein YcgL (UPF0745 family)
MDVLIAKAAPLCKGPDCEALVKLLEELAQKRARGARKLHRLVGSRRREARKRLKAALHEVEHAAASKSLEKNGIPAPPQTLATRLQQWPKLHQANLHDFRKAVKELGYMMQVLDGSDEEKIARFAQVKDAVGEWHDWLELQHAAAEVLGAQDHPILVEIRKRTREQLRHAMTVANGLRRNGFALEAAA